MKSAFEQYRAELDAIREAGTYKNERIITTPQYSRINTTEANGVVNMCANNYLGLSAHPRLIKAAKESYDKWGFGLSSVRFICGTQEIHKELERKIADFVGMEDAILYSSCFDANGGLFETLLGAEDAIISDELNHASIIDGVRLCKAEISGKAHHLPDAAVYDDGAGRGPVCTAIYRVHKIALDRYAATAHHPRVAVQYQQYVFPSAVHDRTAQRVSGRGKN